MLILYNDYEAFLSLFGLQKVDLSGLRPNAKRCCLSVFYSFRVLKGTQCIENRCRIIFLE